MTTRIDDLPGVLARHREWVRSGGGKGERAYLTGANLARADLTGANLTVTNLARANLTGANLTVTDLTGANLTGANLAGADLTGANLAWASLAGADLTRAKGIAWAGPVGSEGRTVYAVDHGETVMVQAGCWWGSVDELRARIAPGGEHGWSPDDEARHRGQYEAASAWLLGALGKDGGS